MDQPLGDGAPEAQPPDDLERRLARMRSDYRSAGMDIADLDPDPVAQFRQWLSDAVAANLVEPTAMTLATADDHGRPAARTVLLKGIVRGGFVFYTNYEGRKGRELRSNPACALLFVWLPLMRQVGVRGSAERILPEDSDAYFAMRPRGAQIGAWASPQSQVVDSRAELERRQRDADQRFPATVPRPPHWGGFRVVPSEIEFWQGGPNRLHDRLRYRRDDGAGRDWIIERLAP